MASLTEPVKKFLKQSGCHYKRPGKGDHDMWYSPISGRTFSVDHEIKSRHTANAICKQAGLPKQF